MRVPTGRYEERTPRAVTVEFLRFDELQSNKRAVTENVSPRGARIVTDWNCAPGKHVLVTAPREGVKSMAREDHCNSKQNRPLCPSALSMRHDFNSLSEEQHIV